MKDAITVRRLAEAVKADPNAPEKWKETLSGHLFAAMRLMLERGAPDATDHVTQ